MNGSFDKPTFGNAHNARFGREGGLEQVAEVGGTKAFPAAIHRGKSWTSGVDIISNKHPPTCSSISATKEKEGPTRSKIYDCPIASKIKFNKR